MLPQIGARSPRSLRSDLLWAGAAAAVLLGVLLVQGPINVEQYHHAHASRRMIQEALLDGHLLFWSSSLGLGTPLPLGENLSMHPLFFLEGLISLRWVLRIFWWLHLTAGGFFLLRLCRELQLAPLVARVVTLTYIFSPTTINYTYTDDWPSIFLGWSFLPLVILLALRVGDEAGVAWRPAALLSLVLAFLLYNSHLGYLITWAIPLAVLLLIATSRAPRRLLTVGAVVLAAGVVAGERLFFIAREASLFPGGLEKRTQAPLSATQWLEQMHRPFDAPIVADLVAGRFAASLARALDTMAAVREPFLGLVFSAAALSGIALAARGTAASDHHRRYRALAAAFAASVVLSMLPAVAVLRGASGMWLYRDPAIIFGLLTAGVWLTVQRRGKAATRLVTVVLVIQSLQVLLVAVVPIVSVYRDRQEGVHFYRGPRRGELARWIETTTGGEPGRVMVSPRIGRILMRERTDLADLSLLAVGDLVPHGLQPVNSYFKNVSMDAVYPSFKLMGGMIGFDGELLTTPTTLDALSVDYLLAFADEGHLVPAGFQPREPGLTSASGAELRLYHNPGAWPGVQLFDPSIADLELPETTACTVPGLFCRDFALLDSHRLGAEPSLIRGEDRFEIHIEPRPEPAVALLSHLYRPAWRAVSDRGERLATFPVAGALLAVEIPAGVTRIDLVYRPRLRRFLAWTGWLAALALVLIALRVRDGSSRRGAPPGT